MLQKNYKETVDELKAVGIKPVVIRDEGGNAEGDFYNYFGLKLESQFEQFFLFGQKYLDGPKFISDKKPAKIFFNEIRSVNACAYVDDVSNYSIIEIFRGTLIGTYDFFLSRNDLFEKEDLKHYKTYADNDAGYFLFQFVMLYFFYHEVGHLIQFSTNDKPHFEFAIGDTSETDILTSHTKEFDADWHSATKLAQHILEHVNEKFPDAENKSQILVSVAGLALSGIYAYYMWRSQQWGKFYIEEESHPHPLVRLRYMFEFMLENLHANIPNGIQMNVVINEALKVNDCLLSQFQSTNNDINKLFWEKMPEINAHIGKIKEHVKSLDYLCINRLSLNIRPHPANP